MALDGIFLTKVKDELNCKAVGLRVDKVNQPTRDEIVLNLRGKGCSYKLIFAFKTDAGILNYLNGKSFEVENIDFKDWFLKNY